jgi:nitrate/nitrite transporter NarK
MFMFSAFLTDLLMKRFNYEYLDAKNLAALVPLIYMVLIPVLSALAQVIGKKTIFWILSCVTAIGTFWMMEILDSQPSFKVTLAVIGLATFYSLYSCVLFSSVCLVVPKQGLQIALSVAAIIQSFLFTTLPPVFGYLNRARDVEAYNHSLFVMRMLAIVALIGAILMTIADFKTGKRLYIPENDPLVLEAKEKLSQNFRESQMIKLT